MRIRAIISLATAALVTASGVSAAHAKTTAGPATAEAPTINWESCADAEWIAHLADVLPQGLQCGEMEAPLDYSNPTGEKVTLRMTKKPATGERVGSIFVNPGGPGGQGTMALGIGLSLGEEVTSKYDVIGIDPRGIGFSERLNCASTDGIDFKNINFFPTNGAEVSAHIINDKKFRDECRHNNPRIARYMTTADLARDLDRAREAVGDKKMTFIGVSYGTQVAATYANMFPNKVRAVVADSALDPNAWTHGDGFRSMHTPAFGRIKSVYGGKLAWDAAMEDCEKAGVEVCASAETVRKDWEYIHQELPKRTVQLDGQTVKYDAYVWSELGAGYKTQGQAALLLSVPVVAQALRAQDPNNTERTTPEVDADKARDAVNKLNELRKLPLMASIPNDPMALAAQKQREKDYPNGLLPGQVMQSMLGVVCSETFNPMDPTGIRHAAAQQDRIKPGEGSARTWQGSACVQWPFRGKNAYWGNYRTPSANGVLVVSNELDTATPHYQGAERMHATLPGSKLVTVKRGYGHGAYFVSKCAKDITRTYVLTGELPKENVTCAQDKSMADVLREMKG